MDKGSAELFNLDFFHGYEDMIAWFDKKGIIKLNDDLKATIILSDRGYHDHFSGYLVEIINNNGSIDTHFFKFDDYLKTRIDTRKDYNGSFEVVAYIGWEWYICKPIDEEVFDMANKIIRYIKMWE